MLGCSTGRLLLAPIAQIHRVDGSYRLLLGKGVGWDIPRSFCPSVSVDRSGPARWAAPQKAMRASTTRHQSLALRTEIFPSSFSPPTAYLRTQPPMRLSLLIPPPTPPSPSASLDVIRYPVLSFAPPCPRQGFSAPRSSSPLSAPFALSLPRISATLTLDCSALLLPSSLQW